MTPVPQGDDRYGVIIHTTGRDAQRHFLDALRTEWFIDGSSGVNDIPSGHKKLLYFPFAVVPSAQEIQTIVAGSPGAVWYILGEPNRYDQQDTRYNATSVVEPLHDFYEAIKAADPTAKITSPSILNWDFTCIGCTGYQQGQVWLKAFISGYNSRYGQNPPIDIWAIDAYPIDWNNTPNSGSHASTVISQLEGMRQYLDTIPQYQTTPIWITEIAVHWGYDSWEYVHKSTGASCSGAQVSAGECRIAVVGQYHPDKLSDYLTNVLDWLDDQGNAQRLKIDKWFFFITYSDVANSEDYAGITFFDGRSSGAVLNCLGDTYKARVLSQSKVKCDASGNTVSQ